VSITGQAAGKSGALVFLGRTILTGANTTIAVTGLSTAAYSFLKVNVQVIAQSAAQALLMTFNADAGATYDNSFSVDGGAASVSAGDANFILTDSIDSKKNYELTIANNASTYRQMCGTGSGTTKTTLVEKNYLFGGAYDTVAASITSIELNSSTAATFGIGSEVAVYGFSRT